MIDPRNIDEISKRLAALVPEGARELRDDLERSFRAALGSAFERLELVTREELEVQEGVLARTREKVEALEARVRELEEMLNTGGLQGGAGSTTPGN